MRNLQRITILIFGLVLIAFAGTKLHSVLMEDRTPPVISCESEVLELSVSEGEDALLRGVTAGDDRDGDLTDRVMVKGLSQLIGADTARVSYIVFDSSDNMATAQRTVRYTDYERPRFFLSRSLTFAYNSGFDLFNIVRAEDALDGNISHRVRITSMDESAIANVGVHQVQLRVTNSLGETVQLVVPVEVYPAGTYGANLTLTDYLIYLPVGAQLDAERFLHTYIRGSVKVPLQDGVPQGCMLQMKNDVQTDVPGVYTVEYRVSQTVGQETYTGYAKLIVVVEG